MNFEDAARKEYETLVQQGVFKVVEWKETTSKPLPLKWVFTYKYDTDGYLSKYKARICVRGDKQKKPLYEDNYTATLAARMFQALMAITAAFDLEAH